MRRILMALLVLGTAAFAAIATSQETAQPEKYALLIGNKNYNAKVGELDNPIKDVTLLKERLERIGFNVTVVTDAGFSKFLQSINRYIAQVSKKKDTVSFFYYSGHGAADPITKINYVIPIDIQDADDPDIWNNSIKQIEIIDKLWVGLPDAIHYIVFDACRNEFQISNERKKQMGVEKSLADKPLGFVGAQPKGKMLIAYSTQAGQTASDKGENAGPYAEALADEIVKPGVESETVFKNVGTVVKSRNGQDPFKGSNTFPPVYFAGLGEPKANPNVTPQAQTQPQPQGPQGFTATEIGDFCAAVEKISSESALRAMEGQAKTSSAMMACLQKQLQDLALKEKTRIAEAKKAEEKAAAQEKQRIAAANAAAAAAADAASKAAAAVATEAAKAALAKKEAEEAAAGAKRKAEAENGPFDQAPAPKLLTVEEARALQVGTRFQECEGCPEMVVVPPGKFTMGAPDSEPQRTGHEGPQHEVTIRYKLAVGRFAVTFGQWDACVADGGCNGYKPDDDDRDRKRMPVSKVSWHDAKRYVAWLSRKTGKRYRLLTEAEREYVMRAGTSTPFPWGSQITSDQANYNAKISYNGGPRGEFRTTYVRVDMFQASKWGLYQLQGNIWEWVEDCWNDNYFGAPSDGSAWLTGNCNERVRRGGSFADAPMFLRSGYRYKYNTSEQKPWLGFRIARDLNN